MLFSGLKIAKYLILQKKLIRSPSNKAAEVNGGIPKVKISGSLTIQTPGLNRFGQLLLTDVFGSVQVGNRAGDFEDVVVGAGGEAETVGDKFKEAVAGSIEFAVLADMARCHLGVAPGLRKPTEDAACYFSIARISNITSSVPPASSRRD
jgi:hypothetical protein